MSVNTAIPEDQRQPTRRGTAENTRVFDQTFLDPDSEIVHRDYAAHFFRWGFAKKNWIQHEVTKVLDVGCGPDRPLMMALFGGIAGPFAKSYVGVDMNKIKPTRHKRTTLYPKTNFIEKWEEIRDKHGPFDLVTNFEVIEHMPPEMGDQLLNAIWECMRDKNSTFLLSTPVYDGKARAKNHIHEYTIPELQAKLENAGFVVERRFGTFMNNQDVRKVASPCELDVYNRLHEYYGNDVMSTFLAPLYPDMSRNNIWVCHPDCE